jgi:hypothetical protein
MGIKLLILVFVIICIVLGFYLLHSTSSYSRFQYIIDEVVVTPSKQNYTVGENVNVNLTFKPHEDTIENHFFKPLTKIELLLSTELRNATCYSIYNGEKHYPTVEIRDMILPVYVYRFSLPKENKLVKVFLNGKTPEPFKKYDVPVTIYYLTQKNYYWFETKDSGIYLFPPNSTSRFKSVWVET